MMTTADDVILYEVVNQVAVITLNRPRQLNAITGELLRLLAKSLTKANRDSGVRAILLTGAGRAFCAGQDLKDMQTESGRDPVYNALIKNYTPVIERLTGIEKPIVAALNGIAAGAGASLALACDLRIMAADAAILMAFSNIALVPDAGATWLLARQVGYSRAFEIAVEGTPVEADRCLALGLTNKVVPADALAAEAQGWAEALAQRPTFAVGLTKRAMHKASQINLPQALNYEAHLQQMAAESHDAMEGIQAFLQKRPPQFEGR